MKREIGGLGHWSVSSFKQGFALNLLRDNSAETYWQSDGAQPHFVNVEFPRKVSISQLSLYLDYKQDESYTPNKIAIKAGMNFHDLHQVAYLECEEPSGWIDIDIREDGEPLDVYFVQVQVLANHQNGKDTHIRQIKVFSAETEEPEVRIR